MTSAPVSLGHRGLAVLGVAYFLTTYLFASANVAVPEVARRLSASPAQQTLILAAFSATFATALVLFGRLGDNRGRRRIFLAGLAAVGITSVAAGFAPDITALIVLRAAQGLGAAAFTPQVLSTVQATATGEARRRAIAVIAATAGLGFCGGQVLGGALLAWDPAGLGWRTVWWSAAGIALVAAAGARAVPDTRAERRLPLDYRGAALLTVALLALLTGLSVGGTLGWPPQSALLVAVAAAAAIIFWAGQRRAEAAGGAPMLPPSVFAHRPIRVGLLMALLFFSGYGALVFEYALVSEHALGMTPLASGVALVPYGAAFVAVSLAQPVIHRRLGERTMPVGAALNAVGLLALAVSGLAAPQVWAWAVQPALIVVGAAQAMQFGPLVGTIMGSVPDRIAGLTGGLVSTAQQAAFALGVATLGTGYTALASGMPAQRAFAVVLVVHAGLAAAFASCARSLHRAPSDDGTVARAPGAPVRSRR
ncbi:MFS transporter [Tsukamurella paurometabola]|uniref:Spectinomycin tetracycline efflux pump n=1 Tax=Tsukamurella paurometabola TaxID=2061 RepID=A0A3P8LCM7_TSUPA|nr:MFS transporter [Tsukamurella paurometabola]UEA84674.1 MFS transporter [Tsukamurella paurometabola]VDR37252.1 Spectinomycin tetracycline efflux pump [Tsukamurella paurometabola]